MSKTATGFLLAPCGLLTPHGFELSSQSIPSAASASDPTVTCGDMRAGCCEPWPLKPDSQLSRALALPSPGEEAAARELCPLIAGMETMSSARDADAPC